MSLLNLEKRHSLNPIPNFANFAAKAISLSNDGVEWILDSGAYDHMTFQRGILHNKTQVISNLPVSIPNGS